MKYALLNTLIVFIINLYVIYRDSNLYTDIMFLKDTNYIPIWVSILSWVYLIWGIFNLYWYIFKL